MKNNNFTNLVILASTAVAILVFIIVKVNLSGKKVEAPIQTAKKRVIPTPPAGDTLEINGVKVKNFYKEGSPPGSLGEVTFVKKAQYSLTYFPEETGFLLVITSSPFEENRKLAEKDLLQVLGITEADMCKLSVYITTPQIYNPNEAGNNYPLSYCNN
ncbi:hypothetical protein A2115_03825 [Candidatus Woesebacteria bacterium GWA1_41_8]|jgi:hypothetical protein|uniref:Uncharacterized protein n=1 Tax=Candidatus Woesebacteria bacterium GWA1_41_8 TaxID=1802471 RepID=A0A1F7WG63_9BACT|nr:MAG: hypothetical protein A2115_03825 [Candidatus Woesebacteria bacterium GWA1_41_8]